MNALVQRILIAAGPVTRPAIYARYLERMPTHELQQKLRDLEESENRSGNGYCPLRTRREPTYETIKATPQRTPLAAEGQGRSLAPA